MNEELSTAEQRLVWRMVAFSGEGFNTEIKSETAPRASLERRRLLEVEKREKQSGKRKQKVMYLRLTDAGWAWCNRNMAWTKPQGEAANFLNVLLQRLGVLFEKRMAVSSLAEFINASALPLPAANEPVGTTEPSNPEPVVPDLPGRIRAACLELGGGREAVRIRIADLRKHLADVHADDLNEAIREFSRRRELTLYPLDDPRQITPDDEAAAILSSTGVPQHILYFGGIAS